MSALCFDVQVESASPFGKKRNKTKIESNNDHVYFGFSDFRYTESWNFRISTTHHDYKIRNQMAMKNIEAKTERYDTMVGESSVYLCIWKP